MCGRRRSVAKLLQSCWRRLLTKPMSPRKLLAAVSGVILLPRSAEILHGKRDCQKPEDSRRYGRVSWYTGAAAAFVRLLGKKPHAGRVPRRISRCLAGDGNRCAGWSAGPLISQVLNAQEAVIRYRPCCRCRPLSVTH